MKYMLRFNSIRLSILLLFSVFSITLKAADNPTFSEENLLRVWHLENVSQGEQSQEKAGYLLLDKSGEGYLYTFSVEGDTLEGNWALNYDTLIFYLELEPIATNPDSLAFVIESNSARLDIYRTGEKLASITDQGLEHGHASMKFIIRHLSENSFTIQNEASGKNYKYSYNNKLKQAPITLNDLGRGLLGVFGLLFITWLLSSDKKAIDWKLVATGISLQIVFALLVLKLSIVMKLFEAVSGFFVKVLDFSYAGSLFLFGDLVSRTDTFGYIFAFQVLPTIVFFSALSSLLYYLGIMQRIVFVFAWVMSKTMRLSGAESLATASNIFIGQTEAPLVVKPYLENMTKSEILCLMVGGMATIAGGVFAAYVGFLGGTDPVQRQYFATHLLTASILSAPAAIVAAKMLFPETEPDKIDREVKIPKAKIGSNLLDAISNGTTDGLRLAINVGAMLLTFTALVFMVNYLLGIIGGWVNINDNIQAATNGRFDGLSLDYILGLAFSPVAWLLGTPWSDSLLLGELLGKKTIINEFVAYERMNVVKDAGLFLHQKSVIIATYALCGFANFASIGIQIGGIGALAPNQRKTLARFGVKALIGGTVASFLTAVIAGVIVG